MTGTATATVETLTAEVRVLMVGSRQVTLSVARQVDTIPIVRLNPFGRVSMGDGKPDVIGVDQTTGALCTSYAKATIRERAAIIISDHEIPRLKPLRCKYSQKSYPGSGEINLIFEGHPIWLLDEDMEDRHRTDKAHCAGKDCTPGKYCTDWGHCSDECQYWNPRDYRADIREQVAEHRQRWIKQLEAIAAAKAMPLIVLAGLR